VKLIIPDVEIARAALVQWPEPYQAKVMTAIFLVENGGDAYAFYVNSDGLFAGYADRGLCAINEAVIKSLRGEWQDPILFVDVDESMRMARDVWDWRFKRAQRLGKSYSSSLVEAYSGWSVYSHQEDKTPLGDGLRARWALMRSRAEQAVEEARA
jgi:hypothetical protein